MKQTFLILLIISFINSCKYDKNEKNQQIVKTKSSKILPKTIIKSGDTIIVKKVNQIESYDSSTIKSFSYFWITQKDTLDFKIRVREFVIDSTKSHISIDIEHSTMHSEKIFFSTALKHLKKCIPIIKQNFSLENLGSIQFEYPNAYKDFITNLPKEYKNKYGKKRITYLELNDFLKQSSIDIELKKMLLSLNKDTYKYSIEKFQVRDAIISGIGILIRIRGDE